MLEQKQTVKGAEPPGVQIGRRQGAGPGVCYNIIFPMTYELCEPTTNTTSLQWPHATSRDATQPSRHRPARALSTVVAAHKAGDAALVMAA